MAESISIKERILRQVRTDMAGISGIGTVYRWDARGLTAYHPLDLIVVEQDEQVLPSPLGPNAAINKQLPVVLAVVLGSDETETITTSAVRNRWQARVEQAIMSNRRIVEAVTLAQLGYWSAVRGITGPELTDGGVAASVLAEIEYMHDETSPYILTGNITLLEE